MVVIIASFVFQLVCFNPRAHLASVNMQLISFQKLYNMLQDDLR